MRDALVFLFGVGTGIFVVTGALTLVGKIMDRRLAKEIKRRAELERRLRDRVVWLWGRGL